MDRAIDDDSDGSTTADENNDVALESLALERNLLARLSLAARMVASPDVRSLFDRSLDLATRWLDPESPSDLPDAHMFDATADVPPDLLPPEGSETEPSAIDALNELRKRHVWPLLEAKAILDRTAGQLDRECVNDVNEFFARVQAKMEALQNYLRGRRAFWLADHAPVENFYAEGLYTLSWVMPASIMPAGVRLLDMTYARLQRTGLRLYENYVVEEIRVERNGALHRTHAYRRLQTTEEYLSAHASAFHHPEEYVLFSKGGFSHCIDALERLRDPRCPTIEPDRHVFAFRDGIMLLKYQPPDEDDCECVWLPYGSEGHASLPDDVVAANFFERDAGIDAHIGDPPAAPTPNFDKIFANQDVPPDAMLHIYAMFGRFIYSINDMDRWQVFLLLFGNAGVGKTTVRHVIERIYPNEDIAHLSNEARPTFPVPPEIHRKKIIVYPESDTRPNFRPTLFQALVCGERIEIPRMFTLKPLNEPVIGHIFADGNKFMTGDTAGSMQRRTVALVFMNRIAEKDSRLADKLDAEMPLLMWKWAHCYLQLCIDVGNDEIWKHLHPYFLQCREYMRAEMNTIHAFFDAKIGTALVESPQAYLSEDEFTYMFREFCRRGGHAKQALSKAFVESALADRGYRFETIISGSTPTRCIVGVGTQEEFGVG